jgi:arginyl-tRNA synthetase
MEQQIIQLIQNIIFDKYQLENAEVKLSVPPKKNLGDFAMNCALLARDLRMNPNIIAEELSKLLESQELVLSAEVAGPYINLKISKDIFTNSFKDIYSDLSVFLHPEVSKGTKIIIDYI